VEIHIQAYPDQRFEGQVSALNPGIDPGTRSLRIRATLVNPNELLRPGMFAQVRTILAKRQDLLTVPQTAIAYNPYGDLVYAIVEKEGVMTVQRRQVQTGEVRDGRVEILSGLEEGERVVSAGHVKLRNGQPVQLESPSS
jgi:membrane fusion protein (multidrug efflux system)